MGCRGRVLHSASFSRAVLVCPVLVPKVTLFIPSLLPPPPDGVEEPSVQRHPALERLLARGRAGNAACPNMTAWLCGGFGIERQLDWPAAPISLLGEGGDPGSGFWLRASPVHLRVQRDQLVLLPPASLSITAAESQALLETLNRHFAADGLLFVAPHPQRWYLRLPTFPDLHTVALEDAIGRDINRMLPTGADRMHYHGLFNEVQMLLHAHPVNESREQAGALAINSVWFWDGGILPPAGRTSWTGAIGDLPLLRGLGRLSNIPIASPAAGLPLPEAGNVLVVLPEGPSGDRPGWTVHMSRLEQEWFAPLLRKLRTGEIRHLEIVTIDTGRARHWTVSPRDLWKFWIPARPLARQVGAAER